jgi:hypothetical protein
VVPYKPQKVEKFHFGWFSFGPSSKRPSVNADDLIMFQAEVSEEILKWHSHSLSLSAEL